MRISILFLLIVCCALPALGTVPAPCTGGPTSDVLKAPGTSTVCGNLTNWECVAEIGSPIVLSTTTGTPTTLLEVTVDNCNDPEPPTDTPPLTTSITTGWSITITVSGGYKCEPLDVGWHVDGSFSFTYGETTTTSVGLSAVGPACSKKHRICSQTKEYMNLKIPIVYKGRFLYTRVSPEPAACVAWGYNPTNGTYSFDCGNGDQTRNSVAKGLAATYVSEDQTDECEFEECSGCPED